MIIFTRGWVTRKLDGLWEEMSGVYRTFPARFTAENGRVTRPAQTPMDLTYARNYIPFSELNAARLLHLVLEDRITYIGSETAGSWYFYNEVYHAEVADGIPVGDMVAEAFADQLRLAMDLVSQEIEIEAVNRANSGGPNVGTVAEERKKLRAQWRDHYAFQARLHSESGLNALKARFRKQCARGVDHFDNDRRWLVFQNGVLDLEGFRKNPVVKENMRDLSPMFAVNRAVTCDFNPEAEAPNWQHFLETSIPDEEVRAFLQRLVGAAFLAESKVKAIPNLQGPKDCGKTIFVSTLERLAGGYGLQPSPSALMLKQGGGDNFEQDTLRGARFVGISEPSPHSRLDDEFCKQVTGGDTVTTRTLHKKSAPWLPQCVIFIASNDPVNFTTSDNAFVERLCLVEFPHRFYDQNELPEGDWHIKDYDLERKLAEESEGIMLWVIRGMWEYLVNGIGKPESVKTAGQNFVTENSGPLSWIAENVAAGRLEIVDDPAMRPVTDYVTLANLHQQYAQDYASSYDKPLPKRVFSKHVAAKYGKSRSGVTRMLGIVGVGSYSWMNNSASENSNIKY